MRVKIGDFYYIRNEENIIDVFSWDGEVDLQVARFIRQGSRILGDNSIEEDSIVIYDTVVKIFNGTITLE